MKKIRPSATGFSVSYAKSHGSSVLPDAAWLLSYRGYKKVYYLELSRGTSGIQQIASSKSPGFAGLAEVQGHKKHFPDTNVPSFTVLAVEPSVNRRDALMRAMKDKPGAKAWKFLAWPEFSPETALFESIVYDAENGAVPLIRRLEGGEK